MRHLHTIQYPLDTNCTYIIKGDPGNQILLYFEQFALFEEASKDACNDWLEIYDVRYDTRGAQIATLQGEVRRLHTLAMPVLQLNIAGRYFRAQQRQYSALTRCASSSTRRLSVGVVVAGRRSSVQHHLFCRKLLGTANGFNALYEIRKAFAEDVPLVGAYFLPSDRGGHYVTHNAQFSEGSDSSHCGRRIEVEFNIKKGVDRPNIISADELRALNSSKQMFCA